MKKYWQNPPHDKMEIRRREEKFPHLRKAKDYKDNCQHKHRFNKSYRTLYDINNKYQYYSVVTKYMDTFDIYKSINYLVKNKSQICGFYFITTLLSPRSPINSFVR